MNLEDGIAVGVDSNARACAVAIRNESTRAVDVSARGRIIARHRVDSLTIRVRSGLGYVRGDTSVQVGDLTF